jgi:hypothetical protein
MRCRETRKKLIELAGGSLTGQEEEALREHLDNCQHCARLVLAERLLTSDLEQLRQTQLTDAKTVEQVRQGIAIREESEKTTNLGARIMRQVSETVYRRPRLSIASAAISVLLLASILVPVRTEQEIEYGVAFAAPASGLIMNEQYAEKMLAALNMDDARVEIHKSPVATEYRIAPLADMAQVRRLIAVLDSLGGGGSHRVLATTQPGEKQTIWELLLENRSGSRQSSSRDSGRLLISVDDLSDLSRKNFILWIPDENRQDDSTAGILIDRQGEKTRIWMPGLKLEPDNRGWNPMLNGNTVLYVETDEGHMVGFDFTDVEDVRKLEKMGYDFWLMEFDTPGQIPVPDMGPRLNKIDSDNPYTEGVVISYMIPHASKAQIHILDKSQREIRSLLDDIVLTGIHSVVWNGRDADGTQVKPGTYLCRFIVGDHMETREILLER